MVFGIILAVIGAVLTAWAYNQMDSLDYGLAKAFLDGDGNESIDLAYYAGIAMLILGILVFFVFSIRFFILQSKHDDIKELTYEKPLIQNEWKCTCGHSNPINASFCSNCGKQKVYNEKTAVFWKCECGSQQRMENNYCSECGRKKDNNEDGRRLV